MVVSFFLMQHQFSCLQNSEVVTVINYAGSMKHKCLEWSLQGLPSLVRLKPPTSTVSLSMKESGKLGEENQTV